MGRVTANRLRWGALAWLLTLQFFVAETVVQLQLDGYSRSDDVISMLGAAISPGARLMNASFVLQAALILAGTLALRPLLRGTAGRAAVVLLGAPRRPARSAPARRRRGRDRRRSGGG